LVENLNRDKKNYHKVLKPMTLEHVALWTENLDGLKEYYCHFFQGKTNKLYINTKTGFKSYFISFEGGARLEIMQMPGIPDNQNDRKAKTASRT
jgi:lactoylglutathione lyase